MNKKVKVNKDVDEIYKTYILKKCVNPPKKGEEQPHFIVFKDYHISYQNFQESLKPRSKISTEVMELYIRHFNLVANKTISKQPICKKFAFFQSITSKLMVDDRTFDPNICKGEFMRVYEEFNLEKFDLLYFAIVHRDHWILCCVNLLYKTSNVFNSLKRSSLDDIYEAADNVVVNFFELALATNTFTRYKRGVFKSDYPQDCPQQRTIYDCGIFTMLFMEKWDGKALKKFDPDHITDFRKLIAEGLIRSPLNTQDSSWVLTWKK